MLVIATKVGFYNRIREVGEKFEYPLKQGDETPTWMERVGKARVDKAKENLASAEDAADAAEAALEAAKERAEAARKHADNVSEDVVVAEENKDNDDFLDTTDEPEVKTEGEEETKDEDKSEGEGLLSGMFNKNK